MTREILLDALGFVEEAFVAEAMTAEKEAVRRTGRWLRTLLIAAAAALLLGAAALAVYGYRIQDAEWELPHYNPFRERMETQSGLSANGFRDSPEYQAYAEWYAWQQQDNMERPNRWEELGVDDMYRETPENYAWLYGAYFADQAAALDEIAERWGMTLHERREVFETEGQLCAALGMDDFLGEDYTKASGYIYEDGSFNAEGRLAGGGGSLFYSLTVSVRGSFAMSSYNHSEHYEQWNCITPGGLELILAKDEDGALVLADLSGAYVVLGLGGEYSREELEALVLGIAWDELGERFDGHVSREEAQTRLEAWLQARTEQTVTDNRDEGAEQVLFLLGNFTIAERPEGSYLWRSEGSYPRNGKGIYSVLHSFMTDSGSGFALGWQTLISGEEGRELDTYLDKWHDTLVESTVSRVQVQGWEAVLAMQDNDGRSGGRVWWLDEERELVFYLSAGGSAEEVLAMAESVVPAGEEVSLTERSRRMESGQEDFDRLEQEQAAQRQAEEEAASRALEEVAALVGRYGFGSLPEGFSFDYEIGQKKEAVWELDGAEESILRRLYHAGDAEGLMLAVHLCENEQGLCPRAVFEARRERAQAKAQTGEAADFQEVSVNGRAAYYTVLNDQTLAVENGEELWVEYRQHILIWLDEDSQRLFGLNYSCLGAEPRLNLQELISLAESVQPEE